RKPYNRVTISRNIFFLYSKYLNGYNFLLSFPTFDFNGIYHTITYITYAILTDY
ncbi:hypothetical protein QBC46DRAFT_259786, partial [Diplogelasinospora grovesii]